MRIKFILCLSVLISDGGLCQANELILKSGEVLRGKLLEKNDKAYLFHMEQGNEKIEVPLAKVSIADIEPSPEPVLKGSVIFYSESENKSSANQESQAKPDRADSPPLPNTTNIIALKSHGDVLKRAEETVALANARTEQAQKQMEEFKRIADEANL